MSENKGGRPTARTVADVVKMARQLTPESMKVLRCAMKDPEAPWGAKIRAAEIVLERGWGAPENLEGLLRDASPADLHRLAMDVARMKLAKEGTDEVRPLREDDGAENSH